MRFINDRQRKAVFAHIFSGKNSFSKDNRFAKQIRDIDSIQGFRLKPEEGEFDYREKEPGEISPDFKSENVGKYYYQEPLTVEGKKFIRDPITRHYSYVKEYMNKSPTTMKLVGKELVPEYETDYYNEVVISALQDELGDVDSLIDSGVVTPLAIEDMSEQLKEKLLDRIDNSEVDSIREHIVKGKKPDMYKGEMVIDIASDNDLYNDAYEIVNKFIKNRAVLPKSIVAKDDDSLTSEDRVSKGDFSPRRKFSKKAVGVSKTDEGYECDYCGADFGTKTSAKVHASMCDEKELNDIYGYESDDNFFNGDDGDPTN